MANKRVLVHRATGIAVQRGDAVQTFRGESATVEDWNEPHKPDSSGRVLLRIEGRKPFLYFPSVIDAEWREEGSL